MVPARAHVVYAKLETNRLCEADTQEDVCKVKNIDQEGSQPRSKAMFASCYLLELASASAVVAKSSPHEGVKSTLVICACPLPISCGTVLMQARAIKGRSSSSHFIY
jgi:hypothetical protein